MFDFSIFVKSWAAAVKAQANVASTENFHSKLSRLGIKAPLGTPPAQEQLAKAIAKSYVANGGSGAFMGEPINEHGSNAQMVRAELVVGKNMTYPQADYLADKAGFM